MAYLLDTNVLSEILRRRPSQSVLERLDQVPVADLFSSSISVMELKFGAARHPRGESLWERIESELLTRVVIIGIGTAEAVRAGEVLSELESAGTPIGVEDVLIGSTALVHDLTVVTRNVKHFQRISHLDVESWWS